MTVQYLYSLRRIYSDEIFKTHEFHKKGEEAIKQTQGIIDTLYQIFPSEEKPDLNWEALARMRRLNTQKKSTGEGPWQFVTLGLCLGLVAINLLFVMVESNMAELAACMVLILELVRDQSIGNFYPILAVGGMLIAKDVLYMTLFDWTDFTDLTSQLDGGGLMLEIVRYAHIPAIILKCLLIGCVFVMTRKDPQREF